MVRSLQRNIFFRVDSEVKLGSHMSNGITGAIGSEVTTVMFYTSSAIKSYEQC